MRLSALLVLALLLSGCQTFPDVPFCTELGPSMGYCVHWISQKDFDVDNSEDPLKKLNGKNWNQIKREAAMCPASECFVPLKQFMENTCRRNKNLCPDQVGKW